MSNNTRLEVLFAEYWRIRRAYLAAQQLVSDLGPLASRKTRNVAESNVEGWKREMSRILKEIQDYPDQRAVMLEQQAPDLVPRNVVPFRNNNRCACGTEIPDEFCPVHSKEGEWPEDGDEPKGSTPGCPNFRGNC